MDTNKSILTDLQRSKEDNSDDSLFYASPRIAHHLDEGFRARLTDVYRQYIPEDSVVLDLMSSWVSHLPEDNKYKRVIGHGLNKFELDKNQALDSYWLQDLNVDQQLPLDDSSIDVCLMVAAWQYLQYPEIIASELKRIISSKGILIISFSNRAFWSKTPSIWRDSSEIDRINYIRAILKSEGWNQLEVIDEKQSSQGIRKFLGINDDPFYSIIAKN